MDGNGSGSYLAFVWAPTGYVLKERFGDMPRPGDVVEDAEQRLRVTKVAGSPLPGDRRPCIYLQPL